MRAVFTWLPQWGPLAYAVKWMCISSPLVGLLLQGGRMLLPQLFTFGSIAFGSAHEVKRSSRIRFPSEQIPQHHNVGQHMYESESQAVPIIISAGGNGLVNGPHYVLPKAPSATNPFGQISTKGYAEGVIIPHTNYHPAQNQEFHQTVPPPIRIPYGLPQSFVMYRQQPANQGIRQPPIIQQQQPDRHRFSIPPRLPYNQLKQLNPNQHAHHQIFASGMAMTKDAQKHPDVAMYRYSIVTNHGQPRPSHPDEFEMEITHGVQDEPTPVPKAKPQIQQGNSYNKPKGHYQQKQTPTKASQKPKDSNSFSDFSDFEQGVPDWQMKGGFKDIFTQSNGFHDKSKTGNKPSVDDFQIPSFGSHDDFSGFDDFPEFPQIPNQNNKRFSTQRKPEFERGSIKPHYKPFTDPSNNENTQKKKAAQKYSPPSFETIKSIELAGGEIYSDENISPSFEFNQKLFKKQEKPQGNLNLNSKQQYISKHHPKKPQKQQNNQEIKFAFNFPQRPDRVKKPQKEQFDNQNFDFSFDFPNQKPLKKHPKQQTNLPPTNYNFEFEAHHQNQQNKNHNKQESSQGSSDWIPINAPDGFVPGRSYDIPAPDLSRDSYEDKRIYRGDWQEEHEDDGGFGFTPPDTVYGIQKGGHTGEEVVSATFRVKQ